MVRLAQTFSLRYPLVDGQGNFGNVDGDNAAAYRYTEARLTATAIDLMEGLDEGSVDYRPTYNGEEEEPEIFPGLFPNLLANGASGIAVGMATSIPPHNAAEIIDAAIHLIDNPKAEHQALMDFVSGPDFPTGGVIVDSAEAIAGAYATGRGGFRVRAKWEVELGRDHQRNPLPGAQIETDRTDRGADQRKEAADPGRRPRRIRREDPDRAGTEEPDGRAAGADGQPVPADRPRGAHIVEPERPRRQADAAGDEPPRDSDRMA
jgi:hypothetical protein